MHCYFLLNIKHGGLTVLLGVPAKYNYEAQKGGGGGRGLSGAPGEGASNSLAPALLVRSLGSGMQCAASLGLLLQRKRRQTDTTCLYVCLLNWHAIFDMWHGSLQSGYQYIFYRISFHFTNDGDVVCNITAEGRVKSCRCLNAAMLIDLLLTSSSWWLTSLTEKGYLLT